MVPLEPLCSCIEIILHHKPCENSLIYYFSLLVKSFEEEIQPSRDHVDATRG